MEVLIGVALRLNNMMTACNYDLGVIKSTESGKSIQNLSDSISDAAQAAMQISASSRQQTVGMEQIGSAMENIKKASSQNVASMDQLQTEAKNLQKTGEKLKLLIAKYQL